MTKSLARATFALTALSAGLLTALVVGCSSSSTSAGPADTGTTAETSTTAETGTKDSGTKETGASETGATDAGKDAVADVVVVADVVTTGDAPSDGPGDAGTLYTRLGGHAGIRMAVNAVVAAELMNADIASYFFFQPGAPANGHPTADQIEECFTDLVGSAAGGPEQYPTTYTSEAGVYTCRSMTTSHRALQINTGTFNSFVTIASGVLTSAGVSGTDIATLGGALLATEAQIVTAGDGGAQAFPGNVDAASQLDATW